MKHLNGIRLKTLSAGLLAVLLLASSVPVSATDYVDIPTDAKVQSYQDQLEALRERQAQATADLQALHTEQGNAWEEKLKLDELINITTQQKQLAEKQIESIRGQIAEKEAAIAETSARIEAQQDAFYERMVDSYTEKKTDYLELVLGAENLVDFLTKFDYVVNILEGDRKIISRLETDKATLASDQEILEEALRIQEGLVADYEKAINERQLLNNSLEEYIETLQTNSEIMVQVINQYQQEQSEVNDSIAQRIAQVQYENELRKEEERKRLAAEEAERQRKAAEEAERKRQEEEWRRQQEAAAEAARQEEEWRRQQEAAAEAARQEEEWRRQQEAAAEAARQEEEWRRQQEEAAAQEEWNDSGWEGDDSGWNSEDSGWNEYPQEDPWRDDGSQWTVDLSEPEEDPYGQNTYKGYDGDRASSGYDGDTSSTWGTGGAWTGDIPEDSYSGGDSWSNLSYSDSYQRYYVEDDYVGGSVSWVLEPGVSYTVSSEQGWRDLYGTADYHLGTDLACPAGTEIHSYNAGTVLISEYHSSYGNYVLVDHGGGLQTLYAHMAERAVSAGDWVESGQILGYVGMTGSAYGYHLHFEVRENGEVQNPRNYLDF